jgi:hypothetical protein
MGHLHNGDTRNRRLRILAIGVKDRNKLTIGGKEVVL